MSFLAAISDIFGRPICLMFSLLAFTVGTIIGAAAPNMGVLLAGRALQGIGGGGVSTSTLVNLSLLRCVGIGSALHALMTFGAAHIPLNHRMTTQPCL